MTKKYLCADRTFDTLAEACAYASFIFKISKLVVAVELVQE